MTTQKHKYGRGKIEQDKQDNPAVKEKSNGPQWMIDTDLFESYGAGKKILFLLSFPIFMHPVYWVVRYIIYLCIQGKDKEERLRIYTKTHLIWAYIMFGTLALAFCLMLGMFVVGV